MEERVADEFGDVTVSVGDDLVAAVEIRRPPNNFFDVSLVRSLVEAFEGLDGRGDCRAIVLCSEGKHFCAGADFAPSTARAVGEGGAGSLYREAARLFDTTTPVVAAVQGAA